MSAPNNPGNPVVSLGLDQTAFNAGIDAAARAISDFDKKFASVAQQIQTRLDNLATGFTTFAKAVSGVQGLLANTTDVFRSARDAAKTYSTAITGLSDAVKRTESTFSRTNKVITDLDTKIVATGTAFKQLESVINGINFAKLNTDIGSLSTSLGNVGKTRAGAALQKISDALANMPKESRSIGRVFLSISKGFERLSTAAQNNNLGAATAALQNFVTAINGMQTGPGIGNLQNITLAAQSAATALQAAAQAAVALGNAPRLRGALVANQPRVVAAATPISPQVRGAVAQVASGGSAAAPSLRRTVQEIKDTERATKALSGETRSFAALFRSAFGELERPVARLRIGLLNLRTLFGFLGGSFVFKQVTESAAEFETQIARIQTILQDTSSVSIKQYATNLQNLAETTSKNIVDLTSSAYIALSAGLPSDDSARGVLSVVAEGAKLATAGLATAPNATEAIVSILNAYSDANLTAAKASQLLQQTVVVGRTTIDQLGRSFGRVAAIGGQFGISSGELAAGLAEITRVVPRTSEAVTQLRALILGIARATPATQARLAKLAETLGRPELATLFSARSIQQRGLFGVLKELNSAVGNSGDVIARLFPNVRALVGGAVLSARGLRNFQSSLDRFENEPDAVGRGVRALEPTFAERRGRAQNRIRNTIDRVGEALLPRIATAFEAFAESVDKNEFLIGDVLSRVVDGFLRFGKAFTAFASAFLDSNLVGIFGSVLGGFAKFVSEFEAIAKLLANLASVLIASKLLTTLGKGLAFLATASARLQADRAASAVLASRSRSASAGIGATAFGAAQPVGRVGAAASTAPYLGSYAGNNRAQLALSGGNTPLLAGRGNLLNAATLAGVNKQINTAGTSILTTIRAQIVKIQTGAVAAISRLGRVALSAVSGLSTVAFVATVVGLVYSFISDIVDGIRKEATDLQLAEIAKTRKAANKAARDAGFTDFEDFERQRDAVRRGEGILSQRRGDLLTPDASGNFLTGNLAQAEAGNALLRQFELVAGAVVGANARVARTPDELREFERDPSAFQLSDPNTPLGRAYADLRIAVQAAAGTQQLIAEDVVNFRQRFNQELTSLQLPTSSANLADTLRANLTESLGVSDTSIIDSLVEVLARRLPEGLRVEDVGEAVNSILIESIQSGDLSAAAVTGLTDSIAQAAAVSVQEIQDRITAAGRTFSPNAFELPNLEDVAPAFDPKTFDKIAQETADSIAVALRKGVGKFGPNLTAAIARAREQGLERVDTTIATAAGVADALADKRFKPVTDQLLTVAQQVEAKNLELAERVRALREQVLGADASLSAAQAELLRGLTENTGNGETANRVLDLIREQAGLDRGASLDSVRAVEAAEQLSRPGLLGSSQLGALGSNIDLASNRQLLADFAASVRAVGDASGPARQELAQLEPVLERNLKTARNFLRGLLDSFEQDFLERLEKARAKNIEASLARTASGQRVRATEVGVDDALRALERQVQDQILNNAREQITAAERLQDLLVKRLQTTNLLKGASVDAADASKRVKDDLQIQLETEQKKLQGLRSQLLVQQELTRLTSARSIEDFAKAADNFERQARETGTRASEATTGKTPNALQASELQRQSGIYLRAAERARELLTQFGVGGIEAVQQGLTKVTDEIEDKSLDSIKKIQDLSIQVRLQPIIRRQEIEAQVRQATTAVGQIAIDLGRNLLDVQKELSALQLAQLDRQEDGLRQLLELTGGYNKDIFEAERRLRDVEVQNRLADEEQNLNRQQREAEIAQQRFELEQQQALLTAQLEGDAKLLGVLTSSDSKLAGIQQSLLDLPQRLADVIRPPRRLDQGAKQAQGIIAGFPIAASPIPSLFTNIANPLPDLFGGIASTIPSLFANPSESVSQTLPGIGAFPGTDPEQNLQILEAQRKSNEAQIAALDQRERVLREIEDLATKRRALDAEAAKTDLERIREGVPLDLLFKAKIIEAFSFGSDILLDIIVSTLKDGAEGLGNALIRGGKVVILGFANLFNNLTSQLSRLVTAPVDALGDAFTMPLDNLFGVLGGALNAILGFNRPDSANAGIPQVLQDGRFGDLPFNEQQRVLDQIRQQEEFRKRQEAGEDGGPKTAAEAGVQAFEQLFAQAVDAINAIAEVFPRIFKQFLERLIDQLPDLIGTLAEVVGEGIGILIAKLPEIIVSVVKGILKGVGGFFGGLFGGIFHDGGRVRPHMRNPSMAGMLARQGAAGFQFGGYVSGQNNLSQAVASRISQDDVVALLQPGERVVSNGEQSRLGGPGALEALLNNGPNPTRNVAVPVPVGGGGNGRIDGLSPQAVKQMTQAFRDALGTNTMRVRR